ncbi:hypothetical protein RCL1_004373 [Eukaryota sp. TZLM3-RCL]
MPNTSWIEGKTRRRSSPKLIDVCADHANCGTSPSFQRVMAKNGDSFVLFSSECLKVHSKSTKAQDRIICMTDRAIYNLLPKSFKCRRRMSLKSLTGVSLSKLADNFLALHFEDYGYLIVLARKTEFVNCLLSIQPSLHSSFNIILSNSFVYRGGKRDLFREVVFESITTDVGNGVSTLIFTVGSPKVEEPNDH